MDVLAAGFVLGVGATWLAHRRRLHVKDAVAWTARQAGLVSGQVSARIAEARRVAREQYEMGRVLAGAGAAEEGDPRPGSADTASLNGAGKAEPTSPTEEHVGSRV